MPLYVVLPSAWCSATLHNMGDNTLSVGEAAKYLGVHRNTVLNRIKSGTTCTGRTRGAYCVATVQQAQYEALAGPFLAQIVQLGQVLGRTEAERDEARKQVDNLRRQLEDRRETPAAAVVDLVAPEYRPWWRRILGG